MEEMGQGSEMKGSAGFPIHLRVSATLTNQTSVNIGYKNDCIQLLRTSLNIMIGNHGDEYLLRSVVFWHCSYIGLILS